MHYTFDLISCMIFAASLFVLWVQRGEQRVRNRAIYGMLILTAVYLVVGVTLAFFWHARTGRAILEPFYALDTLYFGILSLALGFMTLYFSDACLRRTRHTFWIFPIPVAIACLFLFINPRTGWMFRYVNGEYQRGPLLWLNYVVWIIYCAAMVAMVFHARHKLGRRAVGGLLLFFLFELGMQIYQFFIVDFYIGGISFSTGLLYLVLAPMFMDRGSDSLTGLCDRTGFIHSVRDLLRYDPAGEYCIVAVDIHGFRTVNEKAGFQAGNQILKGVASYLKSVFSNDAEIARFNADNFFVITPRDRLVAPIPAFPIREHLPDIDIDVKVTLREGIYPIEDREEEVSQMCDRALFALEQTKGDFQQKFGWFDLRAQEKMQFRSYIATEARRALQDERLQVYYQPIFNVRTGKITGAEALLRWSDENYGMIPPQEFIPVLEENRLVSELDAYVCKKVCGQIRQWRERGLRTVPVSCNVSRVDLLTPRYKNFLISTISECGLTPEDIRVEITESALVYEEAISRELEEMHSIGFRILMDDFGSGYSTFNTFANLPVDILKADLEFVSNLESSARGQGILASIAEMCRSLHIPIVVEGVESAEQLAQIREIGIDYAQGFYFAEPMPAQQFEAVLEAAAEGVS